MLALVGTVLGIASLGPTFSLTEGSLPALSAAATYGDMTKVA